MMLGTWLKAQIKSVKKTQAFHLFKRCSNRVSGQRQKNQAMVSPTKEYKSTISIQENLTA